MAIDTGTTYNYDRVCLYLLSELNYAKGVQEWNTIGHKLVLPAMGISFHKMIATVHTCVYVATFKM